MFPKGSMRWNYEYTFTGCAKAVPASNAARTIV
jgi:hypothetical protein